ARDDRPPNRGTGPDADDGVRAVWRAPLPPRRRPRGGLGASPPGGAAEGRGNATQGDDRGHRPVPARRAVHLPDAGAAPLAVSEPSPRPVPADLARPLLRGVAAPASIHRVGHRSSRPWGRGGPRSGAAVRRRPPSGARGGPW